MALVRERITVLDEPGDLAAPPGSRPWAIAVRDKLREAIHDAEFSAQSLQDYRETMLRFEGYRQLEDHWGRPFTTFESFCRTRPPYGLGYDAAALDAIVEERKSVQARAADPKNLLDPGPPTAAERGDKGNNVTVRGNTAEYLTARIARDRPDILERMRAGEYPSVRAAALDAGIVRQRVSIPLDVEGAARAIRRHFTPDDVAALCELLGSEG